MRGMRNGKSVVGSDGQMKYVPTVRRSTYYVFDLRPTLYPTSPPPPISSTHNPLFFPFSTVLTAANLAYDQLVTWMSRKFNVSFPVHLSLTSSECVDVLCCYSRQTLHGITELHYCCLRISDPCVVCSSVISVDVSGFMGI